METGDTLVPRKYAKEKKLGEWVTDQRRQYKHKMSGKATLLSDERQRKLDELGFVWSIRNRTDWNDRYQQLVEFKKESGNCAVPQMYAKKQSLGQMGFQTERTIPFLFARQTLLHVGRTH